MAWDHICRLLVQAGGPRLLPDKQASMKMPDIVGIAFFADAGANNDSPASPMVTEEAQQMLRDATELDYLTHIIIRMYENKRYASDSLVAVFLPMTYFTAAGSLTI